MRRLLTVALVGLAVTAVATDASAQGRRGGRGRAGAGVMDTARARRMDSVRAVRGDSALRRAPDSLRAKRLDSLRAAGGLDSARGRGRAGIGPAGRGLAPMGGVRALLAGIELNDNEKAAVKTITQKYQTEREQFREANMGAARANRGAGRGQNSQLLTQLQDINEREQAEIRAALTAEHQKAFDANVAKGPAGRRPPRPPGGLK